MLKNGRRVNAVQRDVFFPSAVVGALTPTIPGLSDLSDGQAVTN
jgi:hypothetical protein